MQPWAVLVLALPTSGNRPLDETGNDRLSVATTLASLVPTAMMTVMTATRNASGTEVGVETGRSGISIALRGLGAEARSARIRIRIKTSEYGFMSRLRRHRLTLDRKRDKSAERAARKAEKRRAREELGASLPTVAAELSAYDALDNPFHDANLNQQFKWHKKAEKEKKAGISLQESQHREAIRRQEAKVWNQRFACEITC